MDNYFFVMCLYGLGLVIYFSAKFKLSLPTFLVLLFVAMSVLMLADLLGYLTAAHKTV